MIRTHYQNLKVAENAPPEVIKAAWRALSHQHHPDRNPDDADAGRKMQIINEAYEVLSDPEKRAAHDAAIEKARMAAKPPEKPATAAPQRMWQVFVQGGVLGPYTLAELATLQRAGKITLKTFIASWGDQDWMPLEEWLRRLNKTPVPADGSRPRSAAPRKGNPILGFLARYPWIAIVGFIYLWAFLANIVENHSGKKNMPPQPAMPARAPVSKLNAPPALANPVSYYPPVSPPPSPLYVRPLKTPLGYPWPVSTAYMPGCPILANAGLSEVTIDNSRNSSDVHLKLMDMYSRAVVRECFIKSGGRMTMEDLMPGNYEVRYMDLTSGATAKADPFLLTVEQTASGTSYSILTLTLYKVRHGNTQLKAMPREEF